MVPIPGQEAPTTSGHPLRRRAEDASDCPSAAHAATLVLIDEITEGLQPAVITRLQEILAEERRARGTSILLIEQNVGFALALADRYAVLKVGMIVETGRASAPGAQESIERHLVI